MRSFDPYECCGPNCKAVFPPLDDATGREHDECPRGVCVACGGNDCPEYLCLTATAFQVEVTSNGAEVLKRLADQAKVAHDSLPMGIPT